MAERSGFFNSTNSSNPDRVYDSSDFAAYFASFIGNGVFAKNSDQLRVAQQNSPAMSVQVLGGQAWINGWWYENTSTLNLKIDPADGTLDRIDIVVVQFNLTSREIKTIVRKGSPSAGATAPMLNRSDDLWELKLAEVNVSHGTVNITDGKITDTRSDTNVCGWVSGLIDQMDTTELFNQLKEATQDAVDAMNEALDGSTEGELKAYKKSLRLENNINVGADLNKFTTPGNYSCSAANSASVINKPDGVIDGFMLFVYLQHGGETLQELFSFNTQATWIRTYNGNSFSNWKELAFAEDMKELFSGNWESGAIFVDGIAKYNFIVVQRYNQNDDAFGIICAVKKMKQPLTSLGFTFDTVICGISCNFNGDDAISTASCDMRYNSTTGELRSNVETSYNYPIRRLNATYATTAYGEGIGKIYGVVKK